MAPLDRESILLLELLMATPLKLNIIEFVNEEFVSKAATYGFQILVRQFSFRW